MGKYNSESAGRRFIKGRKQEALAQIEGWVGGSRDEIIKAGAAKVASHPPKNITEQKMLDSRLYDMSRQRFNFIMQCQWEQKLFLEKQKQKIVVMPDLLRNVDLSNIPDNPFALRRSTAPVGKGRTLKSQQNWDQNTTQSLCEKPVEQHSSSLTGDVFVTQRFRKSQNQKMDTSEIFPDRLNFSHRTHTATTLPSDGPALKKEPARQWPISDVRYERLCEMLCENYPKASYISTWRRDVEKIKK